MPRSFLNKLKKLFGLRRKRPTMEEVPATDNRPDTAEYKEKSRPEMTPQMPHHKSKEQTTDSEPQSRPSKRESRSKSLSIISDQHLDPFQELTPKNSFSKEELDPFQESTPKSSFLEEELDPFEDVVQSPVDEEDLRLALEDEEDLGRELEDEEDRRLELEDEEDGGLELEGEEYLGLELEDEEVLGRDLEDEEDLGRDLEDEEDLGRDLEDKEDLGRDLEDDENLRLALEDEESSSDDSDLESYSVDREKSVYISPYLEAVMQQSYETLDSAFFLRTDLDTFQFEVSRFLFDYALDPTTDHYQWRKKPEYHLLDPKEVSILFDFNSLLNFESKTSFFRAWIECKDKNVAERCSDNRRERNLNKFCIAWEPELRITDWRKWFDRARIQKEFAFCLAWKYRYQGEFGEVMYDEDIRGPLLAEMKKWVEKKKVQYGMSC